MKNIPRLEKSPKYHFAGGLVTMVSRTRLRPSQLIKAKNVNILVDGEIEVRGGCTKMSTAAFGTNIDRFVHFKTDTYDKIIAYGGTNVKRLDFGGEDDWTSLDSAMPSGRNFTSMRIANNMLFIGRFNAQPKKYYPGKTELWLAGIVASTTKCSVAEGAAGLLNGTYRWYYTYYNSTTGEEGNPTPISDELTVALKQVTLSGFIASTDPQVDKINIYRNPSGVSQYFYAGQKDNDTDDYTDNVKDDDLGITEISFRNGLPPKSEIFLWHLNRMFYVDEDNPSTLRWSEPFKPGSVHEYSCQEIEQGDGGRIVALAVTYDNIVVLKNTGVFTFFFDPLTPTNSVYQPLSLKDGCVAPMSVANKGEDVIYLSSEGLKKVLDAGSRIEDIKILVTDDTGFKPLKPVTSIFRDCHKTTLKGAVSTYYEAKGHYAISVPYYSDAANDLTLVLQTDSGVFTVHDGWGVRAAALYREFDNELLLRSHDDQYIYRHDYGFDDNEVAIDFEVQTGWHDINDIPDYKRIHLCFPTIYGTDGVQISYEILKDFEVTGKAKSIIHQGASYFGYAHWGQNYWGASGEIRYRHRDRRIGRIFSVKFYGSVTQKIGIVDYQLFYQSKSL